VPFIRRQVRRHGTPRLRRAWQADRKNMEVGTADGNAIATGNDIGEENATSRSSGLTGTAAPTTRV
jgi:hypothetical protein